MLSGLDLFSGIGGLTVALAPWVHPVAYCENDRYACAVLLSGMRRGALPLAPIWDDVRTLLGGLVPVPIDIISAGFPCQDISYAGTGKGLGGKRSSLFFEVLRLSEEILPAFIFLENVPAIRTRGADVVGEELAKRGYDSRWLVASASHFGARHERRRWFCLATNSNRFRFRDEWERSTEGKTKTTRKPWHHGPARPLDRWSYLPSWTTESEMDRMVDGASRWMDRLRALGNGVVPVQAREAFAHLMGLRGVV